MTKYPYATNPANIKNFFEHIQTLGVPSKVTQKYLYSIGFKSSNDRYIIGVLKFLGFLDSSGVATDTWRSYRSKDASASVMASAIRTAYSDLFITYPDAYRKDSEALRNFFTGHTELGERTVVLMVRTFSELCDLANFEAPVTDIGADPSKPTTPEVPSVIQTVSREPKGMTVNINIQLELPATEDVTIYDKLFASLKKHLLSS